MDTPRPRTTNMHCDDSTSRRKTGPQRQTRSFRRHMLASAD